MIHRKGFLWRLLAALAWPFVRGGRAAGAPEPAPVTRLAPASIAQLQARKDAIMTLYHADPAAYAARAGELNALNAQLIEAGAIVAPRFYRAQDMIADETLGGSTEIADEDAA